jgi:hypothetical protein
MSSTSEDRDSADTAHLDVFVDELVGHGVCVDSVFSSLDFRSQCRDFFFADIWSGSRRFFRFREFAGLA